MKDLWYLLHMPAIRKYHKVEANKQNSGEDKTWN